MKKVLSLAMALALCLTMAACGGNNSAPTQDNQSNSGGGTSYANLTYTVSLNEEEGEQYGVGFRKGSDLAAALNDFFKISYAEGTMQTIAGSYGIEGNLIEQ